MTRVISKWNLFHGYRTCLQRKTWYGWKNLSWCYTHILYEVYGADAKLIESWLWWDYRSRIPVDKPYKSMANEINQSFNIK